MNKCPNCNHELVNIVYGNPSLKAIEAAKRDEIALGGTKLSGDMPTHYCYGCHEVWFVYGED